MPETTTAPSFDGVIAVTAAATEVLGGLRLVERAAFTLARSGARRLWCVGIRPAIPLRLPEIPITWARDGISASSAWLLDATPRLVILADTTVTDAPTVAALIAAADPPALCAAEGVMLWQATPAALESALRAGEVSSAFEPPRSAPAWTPPNGALLHAALDPASRRRAERALFATLGRRGDGWLTRVVDRRLSRALTRLLIPLGVTPNQVTLASIAIGVVGGCCFALGTPVTAALGALLFFASTVIDGCDGEIARLTFRESAFGARLDILGDNVVHLFLFGGIALGLHRRSGDPAVAALGIVLVVGVLLAMASVYLCIVRRPPRPAQRALYEAFASREFAYLLVALTLAGRLDWFLWLSAVGTYAFAAGLLVLGRPSAAR